MFALIKTRSEKKNDLLNFDGNRTGIFRYSHEMRGIGNRGTM
jgi:hypothetical protein